ncbi:MAG: hypothetical protein WBP61_02835 [Nocardioides sp.]
MMSTSRLRPLSALAVCAVLVLAGCSSDGSEPEADANTDGSPSAPTASPSESTYLPVPEGVELTPPGSELAVGDHAVVAYMPRQEQVGALDIAVRKLERAKISDLSAWQLSPAQQKSTPYYVTATVKNVGDINLGGRSVPLRIVNEDNVLVDPTPFASSFKPCPSTPFPKKFGPGKSTRTCLVYLAPDKGKLVAVSFRPEETFDPIIWTGDVVNEGEPASGKGGKKKKDQGKKDG